MADYTMRDVVNDLRQIPAKVRQQMRPTLVKAAEPMLRDAKRNASWSSRIPGAIRLAVTKKGVTIVVSASKAPHARAYEGISSDRTGNFRHPVHGHEDRWVTQRQRPFLMPAVNAHKDDVEPAIRQMVQDVAREHGFR